eukprot:TRINITY_DN10770_c0_g1_i10.p3 TRINITY_DN10770_c0_g1~~TRINITY_DN10770_c0_g1_i10.p3  ORF type:complete len:104 (+),score=2.06 TRINITY_DN10770_c0_g1_i10:310-621(+)
MCECKVVIPSNRSWVCSGQAVMQLLIALGLIFGVYQLAKQYNAPEKKPVVCAYPLRWSAVVNRDRILTAIPFYALNMMTFLIKSYVLASFLQNTRTPVEFNDA